MRMIWLIAIGLCSAGAAQAETIAAPKLIPADTWTYQGTTENSAGWRQTRTENTVVRAGPTTVAISVRPEGSTMPPTELLAGADWSRMRNVNGQQTVVNRPFAFPLSVGKTWTLDFTEAQPNRQLSSERRAFVYKVTGWEDVTVPAGTFHALKIEAEGTWTAVMAPAAGAVTGARVDAQGSTTVMQTGRSTPTTVSGRAYSAFWYVPAVKRWVRSEEESYNPNGVRTQRVVTELTAYKVAN